MKRINSKVIGLACLAVFSVSVYAQQVDQTTSTAAVVTEDQVAEDQVAEDQTPTHEHAANAGRMVFIDPDTGKVVSGQRQVDVEGSPKSKSTFVPILGSGVASAPQRLENGSIKIELNGQFIVPISVSVDKDGKLTKGHHSEVDNDSDKESE